LQTLFSREASADIYTWDFGSSIFSGTFAEYNAADYAGGVTLLYVAKTPSYASTSLLSGILANAADLSANVSNISQNLNDIDGTIDVTTSRDFVGLVAGVDGLLGAIDSFGSFSQAIANVSGRDIPATLLAVLDPLTLEMGNLATTAIGALQSGTMAVWFDADGLLSKVTTASTSGMTTANTAAEQHAGIANSIIIQDISVNTGSIDGSVQLILANLDAKADAVATTVIGGLQSEKCPQPLWAAWVLLQTIHHILSLRWLAQTYSKPRLEVVAEFRTSC
jgi:hypothetical protein